MIRKKGDVRNGLKKERIIRNNFQEKEKII